MKDRFGDGKVAPILENAHGRPQYDPTTADQHRKPIVIAGNEHAVDQVNRDIDDDQPGGDAPGADGADARARAIRAAIGAGVVAVVKSHGSSLWTARNAG